MIHSIRVGFEIIAAAMCAGSLGYYIWALASAGSFLRERKKKSAAGNASFCPPVSILKPLKGADPGMYESFRSHCIQDYPEYELIFGVSDTNDPAIALVEQLKAEFPRRAIQLVHCPQALGANRKVSNLVQMLPEARYEYLIVNDSDIGVEPDYLRRVIAPLEQNDVGLATCLYRGVASAAFVSQLEALGISADFIPGVLAAWKLEGGIRFGLGSTLAFRHKDLKAVGGFEAVLDYLADDYQLGKRLSDHGRKVAITETVVQTHLPAYSFVEYLRHQLRWARTVRDSRFWGYIGTVITFGLSWSFIALVLSGGASWAWALFGLLLLGRIALVVNVGGRILRDHEIYSRLWLLPLRDVLAFGIWWSSWIGHKIYWRGDSFILRNGRLIPITQDQKYGKIKHPRHNHEING